MKILYLNLEKMNENQAFIFDQIIDELVTNKDCEILDTGLVSDAQSLLMQPKPFSVFTNAEDKKNNNKNRKKEVGIIFVGNIPKFFTKEKDNQYGVMGEKIGKGGQADVYKSSTFVRRHGQLNFKNAPQHPRLIKQLYSNEVDKDTRQALYDHFPYLRAKVHIPEKIEKTVHIVMHRMPGKPLDTMLKSGFSSKLSQFEFTRKFLQALKKLHDHGIVHNDIKPRNVVVDIVEESVLSVKLIDPDLVQSIKNNKSHHGYGTRDYMAPEYLDANKRGEKAPLHTQSDLYSAAIVLWKAWGLNVMDVKSLLGVMGDEDPNQRKDVDHWINEFDQLERHYILDQATNEAEKVALELAYDAGRRASQACQQLSSENRGAVDRFRGLVFLIRKYCPEGLGFSELESSALSPVNVFIRMLDVNFLRKCDGTFELNHMLDTLTMTFEDNQRKIDLIQEDILHRTNVEARRELNSILKKRDKCQTLDNFYAFNKDISARVNALYETLFDLPKRKEAAVTFLSKKIETSHSYAELRSVYQLLTSQHYQFLKNENNVVLKMFGGQGTTRSQSTLMVAMQKKAWELFEKETNKNDAVQKYDIFFSEKSGRIMQSEYAAKFEKRKSRTLRLS